MSKHKLPPVHSQHQQIPAVQPRKRLLAGRARLTGRSLSETCPAGEIVPMVQEVEGQDMGLLRFTLGGWEDVDRIRTELTPTVRDNIDMTGTLQRIIQAGRIPVAAIPHHGDWGEVDSPDDLAAY